MRREYWCGRGEYAGGAAGAVYECAEIAVKADLLTAYLREAIEVEKTGAQVRYKETAEFAVPEELTAMMKKEPALKKAFAALTPGRQRGYLLYFAGRSNPPHGPRGSRSAGTRSSRARDCATNEDSRRDRQRNTWDIRQAARTASSPRLGPVNNLLSSQADRHAMAAAMVPEKIALTLRLRKTRSKIMIP